MAASQRKFKTKVQGGQSPKSEAGADIMKMLADMLKPVMEQLDGINQQLTLMNQNFALQQHQLAETEKKVEHASEL